MRKGQYKSIERLKKFSEYTVADNNSFCDTNDWEIQEFGTKEDDDEIKVFVTIGDNKSSPLHACFLIRKYGKTEYPVVNYLGMKTYKKFNTGSLSIISVILEQIQWGADLYNEWRK